MARLTIDPGQWAQEQFGAGEWGDRRRTKRLVKAAQQAAARPDGSTPDQTECWGDGKAVYPGLFVGCVEYAFAQCGVFRKPLIEKTARFLKTASFAYVTHRGVRTYFTHPT